MKSAEKDQAHLFDTERDVGSDDAPYLLYFCQFPFLMTFALLSCNPYQFFCLTPGNAT